ncbi:hypothetical protein ACRRTK_010451 [Alexandromys fortis]
MHLYKPACADIPSPKLGLPKSSESALKCRRHLTVTKTQPQGACWPVRPSGTSEWKCLEKFLRVHGVSLQETTKAKTGMAYSMMEVPESQDLKITEFHGPYFLTPPKSTGILKPDFPNKRSNPQAKLVSPPHHLQEPFRTSLQCLRVSAGVYRVNLIVPTGNFHSEKKVTGYVPVLLKGPDAIAVFSRAFHQSTVFITDRNAEKVSQYQQNKIAQINKDVTEHQRCLGSIAELTVKDMIRPFLKMLQEQSLGGTQEQGAIASDRQYPPRLPLPPGSLASL